MVPVTHWRGHVNDSFNQFGFLEVRHRFIAPFKLIAFDNGVNVTLGLPFVRTSPDHGTAPDIAGKGIARPAGMIAAINLAARLVHSR